MSTSEILHDILEKYKKLEKVSENNDMESETSEKDEQKIPELPELEKESIEKLQISTKESEMKYASDATQKKSLAEPYVSSQPVKRVIFTDGGTELVYAMIDIQNKIYKIFEIELTNENINYANFFTNSVSMIEINPEKEMIPEMYKHIKTKLIAFLQNKKDISLSDETIKKISWYILKNYSYYEMTPLLLDKQLENINANENNLVIIHDSLYNDTFTTNMILSTVQLDHIIRKFVEFKGHQITRSKMTENVMLPEKSRFTTIYPYEEEGKMSFAIRKQVYELITPIQSFTKNFVSLSTLAFLAWVMYHRDLGTIGILGQTRAGKTSFLKTLSMFIPSKSNIFSIETTPELILNQPGWTPNIVSEKEGEEESRRKQVALLNSALMYSPDYFILGEVKFDRELMDNMFGIIASGVNTMFTFHSTSTTEFITKLQGRNFEITKERIPGINFLIYVIEDKNVNTRYVTELDEIYDFDNEKGIVLYKKLMQTQLANIKKYSNTEIERLDNLFIDTKNHISNDTYEKFCKVSQIKIKEKDTLLINILNSNNILNYVEIHAGNDIDTNYPISIPQLRYWKSYKSIYDEMNMIRAELAKLVIEDPNMDKDKFSRNWNRFIEDNKLM